MAVVETDAPILAPIPQRAEVVRTVTILVREHVRKVAQLHAVPDVRKVAQSHVIPGVRKVVPVVADTTVRVPAQEIVDMAVRKLVRERQPELVKHARNPVHNIVVMVVYIHAQGIVTVIAALPVPTDVIRHVQTLPIHPAYHVMALVKIIVALLVPLIALLLVRDIVKEPQVNNLIKM
jgi:hypothetical protein